MARLGLSALMEAVNHTEEAKNRNTVLLESMEEGVDEDLKILVGGQDCGFTPEESLEVDMAGLGIDDEEKMAKLLDLIPEDDEGLEDDIEEITEGFFGAVPDNFIPTF